MEYPNISKECHSLLCKCLTKEIFEILKEKETANGFTLEKAIKSGLKNSDSSIGVYAGDVESYEIFSPLFDPIIEAYHGFGKAEIHESNFDPSELIDAEVDRDGDYILSTRIRVGRNLDAFPLGTIISDKERLEVEQIVSRALSSFTGELAGTYYPLLGMQKEIQVQLIEDHFLFKEGDRFLEAAGLNRAWPEGRGIFHNRDKSFLVWVNEEDELRIISMQKGGDIKAVFTRLANAIHEMEKSMSFSYSKHLGYISSCPTNLGTAMRASVHIKLPFLSTQMENFKEITEKYHLQIRGVHGEHSQSEDGIFDISNRRRLGVTEVEAVQDMIDGVKALIAKEQFLEKE